MPFTPTRLTTPKLKLGTFSEQIRKKDFYGDELTPSQQELVPYLQEEARKQAQRKGLLQPVEAIFDLLNRGQYLTAGITQKILRNIESGRPILEDMPKAIGDAVTGRVKSDWEVIFFGGKHKGGKEYEGLFPWEPSTGVGKFAKGAAGFGLNVFLDPITYLGFGPSTAARMAATKYSDDVVRLAIRGIGRNAKEVLPEMIQKGFNKEVLVSKLAKNLPEGLQYLQKYAGGDVTRFYSQLKKKAFREALRKPGKELSDKLLKDLEQELAERTGKRIIKAPKKGAKILRKAADPLDELRNTIAKLKAEPYAGAGQRAGRFMRKEFAVGERYPTWLQSMDKMMGRLRESKIGGTFSDAWWALANNPKSPVANIRKMLHIRNPYQKLLSILERDVVADFTDSLAKKGFQIDELTEDLTDAEMKLTVKSMVQSQILQERAKQSTKVVMMSATEIAQKYGKDVDIEKVTKAIDGINRMTGDWRQFNVAAYEDGLTSKIGEWMDYLPEQPTGKTGWKRSGTQLGTAESGFQHAREAGWAENIKSQVEKIKWMFGFDEELARKALVEGVGDLNFDLVSMLKRRAFGQARLEQRINMINTFREFGIKLDDIKTLPNGEDIYKELTGKWGQLEQLGLKPINTRGLEGYIFDREIAEILERAVNATQSDETMNIFVRTFNNFTSWWRGWATLSPGFHMRNFYSNNMTGFLKHGTEWINPKQHVEAFVGSVIGLHGVEDGIARLSKIMPKETVREIVFRRIGTNTLAEHAQYGASHGLITRMVKGFAQPERIEDMAKAGGGLNVNPFSKEFAGMKGSRALGGYIESTARFQSYLLDLKRGIKQGASQDAAMEYAKMEAKKWFIDYTDLTVMEQKFLKSVIPFYTWIRGNLANQITGLMRFPEMYAMIPKATQAVTKEGGPEKEELPEWMRELGMFPIGEGEEGKPRMFWPNLPYMDINKIPMRFQMDPDTGIPMPVAESLWDFVSDIAADAHPIIKSIIQVIPEEGVDIFYREPLGETRKAPRALRILTKAKPLLSFLDGLMRRVGFEEGMRLDVNKKGQLVMDAKMAKVLEDNILPLKMIPKYFDLPELLFPAIEDWKRKVTGAVDDYDAMEELLQTLSFYAGVKMKDLEIEEEQFRRKEELFEKAQKARGKVKKKLPGAEVRSQEWRQKRKEYHKRFGL